MLSFVRKRLKASPGVEPSKTSSDGTIDPSLLQRNLRLDLGEANEYVSKESPPYELEDQIPLSTPELNLEDIGCLGFPAINSREPTELEGFPEPQTLHEYANIIDTALEATCRSEATKETNASIEHDRYALGKEVLTACSEITEKTDLQHFPNMVRCYQDIANFYNCCSREEVYGLWQFARDYAARLCTQIRDVWYYNCFEVEWYDKIVNRKGWKQFSPFVGMSPREKMLDTPWPSARPLDDDYGLRVLLTELDNTTQAMTELCRDCVRDYQIDPTQVGSQEVFQDIETSDSYDTDDGDDYRYASVRYRLEAFQNDSNSNLLRIGPVSESRARKDIRAWARIARYACIRLPNDTMLVHKEWVQRSRRHHKKRKTDSHAGGEYEYAQIKCTYCPERFKTKIEAERHENSLHFLCYSWSCASLRADEVFRASTSIHADVCGYCGNEFPNPPQWEVRAAHLTNVHRFEQCTQAMKFYRLDHFRQHLKHYHQGVISDKWTTSILENVCMTREANIDLATSHGEVEHLDPSMTTAWEPFGWEYPLAKLPEPPDVAMKEHFECDIWQPRDKYTGYASAGSMSSGSMASTGSRVNNRRLPRDRRRLPRDENGYPCDFPGCDRTYDRQCDLRQHKRCHRREDDLPYQCNICWKRCPFPKDLKRHMRRHGK